ncbi:hypothetical protein C7121_02615 [Paenibacillus glucanolyticus]|nr:MULTISPECIES: hypothetical protein [Paenibacillus]ANA80809.1 hypothetical protein A3958_12890 [Paenibacillus glucanolyticus]AVV55118.1 hypothetical protein C7121_02615 [Paenibacillus glucanolyticus]ETT31044.1 hypothetical protein C169_25770 [Paenibacillus sp. FSL R5-808]MPY15413.1 hypothetical protein [Paenibacillus glucanolyticus]
MQQVLHNAMKIVKKDFASDKLQILWTMLFMAYMGFSASFIMNSQFEHMNEHSNPFIDFILVLYAPLLGFLFSRRSFRYLNEDSYTRMLYFYRSIPVPASAIFVSRIMNSLIAYAINSIMFFGFMYAIGGHIRATMDIPSYIAFSLTWIGIGFLITGPYIYWENMCSGKAYFRNTLVVMVLTSGSVVLFNLLGYSLFDFIANASIRWSLISPVMWGSLIIGLGAMLLMSKFTYTRQQTRDLT